MRRGELGGLLRSGVCRIGPVGVVHAHAGPPPAFSWQNWRSAGVLVGRSGTREKQRERREE